MSVLTRIKNNQILDSTIYANAKIVPGSIVGTLFNSNLTMTADVTITGNLTVQGASTYLTVASTNTYVNDPLIVMNNAFSGTNTYDLGFIFNRGSLLNQAIIWNESSNEFRFVGTTETGTTYGNINQTNYANVRLGNLDVVFSAGFGSIESQGSITGASLNVSGNVLANTVGASYLTASTATIGNISAVNFGNTGAVFTGASINLSGNVLAADGVFNALTVNGNETVTGYLNVTGNILGADATFDSATVDGNATVTGYLNVTGNVLATGGVYDLLTVNGNIASTGFINTSGNVSASQLIAERLTTRSGYGNILLTQFNSIFADANGSQNIVAIQLSTTGLSDGMGMLGTTNLDSVLYSSRGIVFRTGATMRNTDTPTGGVTLVAITATGDLWANSTTPASNTTTGAFVVKGGVGIGGNLYVGGGLNVTGDETITGYLNVTGNVIANVVTASQINTTGNVLATAGVFNSLTVNGDQAVNGNVNVTGNILTAQLDAGQINTTGNVLAATVGAAYVTASTATFGNISAATIGNSTSLVTGLTAEFSGNVIGGLASFAAINNTPIGNATPSTGAFTTLTSSGTTQFTDSTNATGVGTGAVQVTGGMSVGGNLFVGGNINFVGSSFVLTGNSGVFYGDANGFKALYAGVTGYATLPQTVFQTSANYNGYVQNNFENINTGAQASTDWVATAGEGTDTDHYIDMGITTVNWDGTQDNSLTNAVGAIDGYMYVQGNLTTGQGGNLTVGASTPGAKEVRIIAGGNTASYISAVFRNPNTPATTTTTGAFTVAGGVGITGNAVIGGNLLAQGATVLQSTLTTTGAVSFTNSTNSTSATQGGALTVTGGAAIAKDLWVGGNVYAANIIGTSYQYLTIVDPLVNFRANSTYPYSYDIGFYSAFTGGPANVEATSGVIRDNADGVWKFFSNAGEPAGGSVTFDSDTLWDGIKAGNLFLTDATNSSSNSTGAFIVTGGAGVGGSLYARDIQSTVIGNVAPAAGFFTQLNATGNVVATDYRGGSLNVTGNVSAATLNAGQINTTGNVLAATVGAGYVSASTATFGNISAVTIGNTGATVTGTSGEFGAVTSGFIGNTGTAFTGASVNVTGNVSASTFVGNLITSNSGAVTGEIFAEDTVLNIASGTSNIRIYSSNNIAIGSNGVANVVVIGTTSTTLTGNLLPSANLTYNLGSLTQRWDSGYFAGEVLANTVSALSVSATNATFTNFSAGAIGNVVTVYTGASINLVGNVLATNIIVSSATVNGDVSGGLASFAAINNTPIGNATASTGAFTTLSASAGIWANSSTESTSTSTGSIVSAGGLGLAGNIFHGGAYLDTSASNYIFASTPTTVDAFKSATDLELGATSGTLTINNPTVVGSQSTQNLYNTVATAINFAGEANVTIGAPSGVTTVSGGANVRAITDSTTYTTGALTVAGGVGVAGNINIAADKKLVIGAEAAGAIVRANSAISVTGNITQDLTVSVRNLSNIGTSEFSVESDTGYTALFGITSSAYSDTPSRLAASTAYVQSFATDLVIGSGFDVDITVGGTDEANVIASYSATHSNVTIYSTGPAITPRTGAFTVAGGVGVGANLVVNSGAIFNYGQTASNVVIRGVTNAAGVVYDAGNQHLFVNGPGYEGNTRPIKGATFAIRSQDAILIPVGSTSKRPGNDGNVDITGMMRFNSTSNNLEWYNGTDWAIPGASTTVITDQQILGNGVATTFTINNASTTNSTIVSINGVVQAPVTAYGITGTTLTFTEAPADGDLIDVRTLTTTSVIAGLTSANGFMSIDLTDVTNTYANITAGASSATTRISITTDGIVSLVNDAKIANQNPSINIASASTPYVLDTFVQTKFSTAKYVVQAKRGATNIESMDAIVITDGTGNAFVSVYGVINNGTAMGTLSANVLAGNVQLYYTSTSLTNSNVRVTTSYIK